MCKRELVHLRLDDEQPFRPKSPLLHHKNPMNTHWEAKTTTGNGLTACMNLVCKAKWGRYFLQHCLLLG